MFESGDTVLIGFLQSGAPETILQSVLNSATQRFDNRLNDTGTSEMTTIKIMQRRQSKKGYCILYRRKSWSNANGQSESVELSPQGTLTKDTPRGAGVRLFIPCLVGTIAERVKKAHFQRR